MSRTDNFKNLFNVEASVAVADMTKLLNVTDSQTFITWAELNITKRPNVIENIRLRGFMQNCLKTTSLFKDKYDPNFVSLTLLTFQGAYESMINKSCIVLFEASKESFKGKPWYSESFKALEKKYNTGDMITFISNCLTQEHNANGSFAALKDVFERLRSNRLNQLRNAVAHNMYVVEGDSESTSRICYSGEADRPYFIKKNYRTIKTSEFLKLIDMMDFVRDLFLESINGINIPNVNMISCQCGMRAFAKHSEISKKKCYFCEEVGNFEVIPVSFDNHLPLLP